MTRVFLSNEHVHIYANRFLTNYRRTGIVMRRPKIDRPFVFAIYYHIGVFAAYIGRSR